MFAAFILVNVSLCSMVLLFDIFVFWSVALRTKSAVLGKLNTKSASFCGIGGFWSFVVSKVSFQVAWWWKCSSKKIRPNRCWGVVLQPILTKFGQNVEKRKNVCQNLWFSRNNAENNFAISVVLTLNMWKFVFRILVKNQVSSRSKGAFWLKISLLLRKEMFSLRSSLLFGGGQAFRNPEREKWQGTAVL